MAEPDLFTNAGMIIPDKVREGMKSKINEVDRQISEQPLMPDICEVMEQDLREIADQLQGMREAVP